MFEQETAIREAKTSLKSGDVTVFKYASRSGFGVRIATDYGAVIVPIDCQGVEPGKESDFVGHIAAFLSARLKSMISAAYSSGISDGQRWGELMAERVREEAARGLTTPEDRAQN